MTFLPQNLFKVHNRAPILQIEIVDLSKNLLENFDVQLDTLSYMIYLNISYNRIKTLNSDLFVKLKKLDKLDLSQNNLMCLNESLFQNQGYLSFLNLGSNSIRIINENQFFSLTSLQDLDISNNSIENINSTLFKNLKNMKNLYMHLNLLKIIEPLSGLNSIRNIYLEGFVFRENFANLVNLKNSIQVKLIKTTRGIKMFRPVNMIYSNLGQNGRVYDHNALGEECTRTNLLG